MSREIKFRVIYNGEIIGYEKLTDEGWQWMDIRLNPDKGERWTSGAYPIHTGVKYLRGQFTGLKDKNGKEIYEGDILRISEHYPASGGKWTEQMVEVLFENGCFVVRSKKGFYALLKDVSKISELLGNTYENPNLLTSTT